MTDLERFVRRLVELLELEDPDGIHRPVTVAELRQQLIPYRANRSAVGVVSVEDYELLVLRLVAEEGEFVRTNPPAAATQAREELASPNPNLDLVEELADATVQIGAPALARILAFGNLQVLPMEPLPSEPPTSPVEDPAPPVAAPLRPALPIMEVPEFEALEPAETVPVTTPARAPRAWQGRSDPAPPSGRCPACAAPLPVGREVMFCPFCGHRLGSRRCQGCGSELEPGWRHCITCGQVAGPPPVA